MTKPILVAGDSYSMDWPGQFATLVSNHVTNISSRGRSNLYIWSSVVNYLATKPNEKFLVIVGNSFVTRTDSWIGEPRIGEFWDHESHPERERWNRSTPLQHFDQRYAEWFKTADICTLWQSYYYELYSFAHTLKSLGHDFYLFNAAQNLMGDPELNENFRGYLFKTPYYVWCHQQSNILPGATFSVRDWCKEHNVATNETGHIANQEGCLVFSKWLKHELEKVKLI